MSNAQVVPRRYPIPAEPRVPGRAVKLGPVSVEHPDGAASTLVSKVGLSEICLSYRAQSGERLLALDHINLQVRAGEFVCIVGPSGCGKSTLLHLIAGLQAQTSGQVLVDGHPVQGPGTDRILIFQEHGLFPWLTVAENVEFGMKMKGVPRADRRERTSHYLRLVHLAKFEKSYIHQLSGGMKQRVAIARALATEPDVLRLGDRVVLLTFRPGRVKSEFPVQLPRPRSLEDPEVALAAREVLDELREEINRSLEAEYNEGVKPHIKPGGQA